MKRLTVAFIALSGFGFTASPGYAALDNIKFNGFLTIGATYSNSEAPYDKDRPPCPSSPTSVCPGDNLISEDGNITTDLDFINDTRVGLQVSAAVNPQIDVTAQLLARAKQDNSDLFIDWAFATYRATDWL